MSTFVEYYNATKKDFKYTIKLAKNDLTEECFSKLEQHLAKYNIVSISEFKKTPIQHCPIDFPNVKDTEVYIADVVLSYPITPDALLREVSAGMKLSEQNVAIYSENDPRKQYSEEWMDRVVNNKEFKEKYKPFLGGVDEAVDKPAYGDKYNETFLQSLKDVKKDRKETIVTNDLIPPAATDTVTVTGDEKSPVNNDAVLNDRWRSATDSSPRKENTLMSKPSKEKK